MAECTRDLALFNLAIDSKLRGCDLVKLQVRDVAQNGKAGTRATVMQQKTSQPVKFELTPQTEKRWTRGSQKPILIRPNIFSPVA